MTSFHQRQHGARNAIGRGLERFELDRARSELSLELTSNCLVVTREYANPSITTGWQRPTPVYRHLSSSLLTAPHRPLSHSSHRFSFSFPLTLSLEAVLRGTPSATKIRFAPLLFPRDFQTANRGQSRAHPPRLRFLHCGKLEIRNRSYASCYLLRFSYRGRRRSRIKPMCRVVFRRRESWRIVPGRFSSCYVVSRRVVSCRVASLQQRHRPTFPNLAFSHTLVSFSQIRHEFTWNRRISNPFLSFEYNYSAYICVSQFAFAFMSHSRSPCTQFFSNFYRTFVSLITD